MKKYDLKYIFVPKSDILQKSGYWWLVKPSALDNGYSLKILGWRKTITRKNQTDLAMAGRPYLWLLISLDLVSFPWPAQ